MNRLSRSTLAVFAAALVAAPGIGLAQQVQVQ